MLNLLICICYCRRRAGWSAGYRSSMAGLLRPVLRSVPATAATRRTAGTTSTVSSTHITSQPGNPGCYSCSWRTSCRRTTKSVQPIRVEKVTDFLSEMLPHVRLTWSSLPTFLVSTLMMSSYSTMSYDQSFQAEPSSAKPYSWYLRNLHLFFHVSLYIALTSHVTCQA